MPTEAEIQAAIKEGRIPAIHQAKYRRALEGNRPAAVRCMCLECQGWDDGAMKAVRECQATRCPLWAVRPYQRDEVENEDALATYRPGGEVEEP